jgi:hypothetical protein
MTRGEFLRRFESLLNKPEPPRQMDLLGFLE